MKHLFFVLLFTCLIATTAFASYHTSDFIDTTNRLLPQSLIEKDFEADSGGWYPETETPHLKKMSTRVNDDSFSSIWPRSFDDFKDWQSHFPEEEVSEITL